MPTSRPFSASSFADSCPIPESDAVTMATGLISSPLVRKIYPPGSMPLEWRAQTEYSRTTSRRCQYLHRGYLEGGRRSEPRHPWAYLLRIAPPKAPLLCHELQFPHPFDVDAYHERQRRCRNRRRPTRERSRQRPQWVPPRLRLAVVCSTRRSPVVGFSALSVSATRCLGG